MTPHAATLIGAVRAATNDPDTAIHHWTVEETSRWPRTRVRVTLCFVVGAEEWSVTVETPIDSLPDLQRDLRTAAAECDRLAGTPLLPTDTRPGGRE